MLKLVKSIFNTTRESSKEAKEIGGKDILCNK